MVRYLFGYGSLINLTSAARTLKRELNKNDVIPAVLAGYERSWTLWDDVISEELQQQLKGVFLNVISDADSYLNGILIEINDIELEYFKLREKNYLCTDITPQVGVYEPHFRKRDYEVVTFVGKKEYLTPDQPNENYAVFNRYIDIVQKGLELFGDAFTAAFNETTKANVFREIDGGYSFANTSQQKAR